MTIAIRMVILHCQNSLDQGRNHTTTEIKRAIPQTKGTAALLFCLPFSARHTPLYEPRNTSPSQWPTEEPSPTTAAAPLSLAHYSTTTNKSRNNSNQHDQMRILATHCALNLWMAVLSGECRQGIPLGRRRRERYGPRCRESGEP